MASDDLVAEEIGRVYDLFRAQLRTFGRALNGLLATGLIVFALIVVPFLGFGIQLDTFQERQKELSKQQTGAENEFADASRAQKSLKGYLEQVDQFSLLREYEETEDMIETAHGRQDIVTELRAQYLADPSEGVRDWAAGRRPTPPPDSRLMISPQRAGLVDSCDFRLNGGEDGITDHVACQMCASFKEQSQAMQGLISRMPDEIRAAAGVSDDAPIFLAQRACGWLIGGQVHWFKGEPRPAEARELRGFFTWDLKDYEDAARAYRRELSSRTAELQSGIEDLDAQIELYQAESVSIAEQLDRIAKFDQLTTPIGNLPITLVQIVLLFPPALAAAFLVVANSLGRLAILQCELARLFSRRDSAEAETDWNHISVAAPMWLDRSDGPLALVMKWAVLLTPLGLILANLWLIGQAGTLASNIPEGSAIPSDAYRWLYAISIALTLGALVHIARASSRTRSRDRAPRR